MTGLRFLAVLLNIGLLSYIAYSLVSGGMPKGGDLLVAVIYTATSVASLTAILTNRKVTLGKLNIEPKQPPPKE